MSKLCKLTYFVLLLNFLEVNSNHCSRLYEAYNTESSSVKEKPRVGRDNMKKYEIVIGGGGGYQRASAALLLIIMRIKLLHKARLDPTHVDICQIMDNRSVMIAPGASTTHFGCEIGDRDTNSFSQSKPTIVPIDLYFMARISPTSNCKIDPSRTLLHTIAAKCGFMTTDDIKFHSIKGRINIHCNPPCILVLARNQSSYDSQIIQQFVSEAILNKLNISIITFNNDTSFRREIFKLYKTNESYIFIDESILWTNKSDIFQSAPSCPKSKIYCAKDYHMFGAGNVIRISDGDFSKDFAHIYNLVNKYSPNLQYIRDILIDEAFSDKLDITESACSWALRHRDKFDQLYRDEYYINVITCRNDPYISLYKNISIIVSRDFLNKEIREFIYIIQGVILNCTDIYALKNVLAKNPPNLTGYITFSWYPGIAGAANAVKTTHIPLMIAGPAHDGILGESTYTTSGKISGLARAYRFFLSQCSWSRVAIISDHTEYSQDFAEAIISEKALNYVHVLVNQSTISLELKEMVYKDARIFIINTDCQTAQMILSEAANLLTSLSNYVWIVRDWCIDEKKTKIEDLVHFTINFSWRGGKALGGSEKLRSLARNVKISASVSYLVDALLLLGYGFAAYRRQYFDRRYDLYGLRTSQLDFYKVLSATNVSGLAQNMISKYYSLSEPFVYVDKWQGNEKDSVAIWKLANDSVISVWSAVNDTDSCYSILSSPRVSDSDNCIIHSGNDFTPRCHDFVILILIGAIVFIIIAIYLAHKKRKTRLLAEKKILMSKLLESRQEKASALIEFLVDRGSIRLLHEIGSGCYGRVRFAELTRPGCTTQIVAAKEPHESLISRVEENEILREASVLAGLEHSNVIRLMGVCLTDGPPIVLMELASYLDLLRYLTGRRDLIMTMGYDKDSDYEVSDESLTKWAIEATSALEYLAKRRLVHRDIRAANCLINKKRSLKLSDFGMARELGETESTYMSCRRGLFPVLWMSPESLKHGIFSLASEIWSAGVLLLEIATIGARPYGDWPKCRVVCHVVNGGRPPLPPDASMQMRKLLQRCWHLDPEKRITATQLLEYLNENPKAISAALLSPEPPLKPHETDIKFLT